MIELYGMSSPSVLKIVLMLEETRLPYRLNRISVWAGEQFGDAFRSLNPNGKVPVIVDPDGPGGAPFTVFESGAILMYLADKAGLFWPADPRARHVVGQWLMIQMCGVGPMFGQYVHFMRYAGAGNDYALNRYRTEMLRLSAVLDRRLDETPYLAGEDYTIADIATWPSLRSHEFLGIPLADHPHLARWIAAVGTRPAALRTAAVAAEITPLDLKEIESADPERLDRMFGRGRFAAA
jgi:GST-like protein